MCKAAFLPKLQMRAQRPNPAAAEQPASLTTGMQPANTTSDSRSELAVSLQT